jgi:SAM-dependent methyltransferase
MVDTAPEPHQARAVAESFGVDAERYDRSRPQYPGALIAAITAAAPGTAVLDVGIGTGILARQLRAAGCTVLGVEPDQRMAEFARGTGLDVEPGTIEEWDPAGRTFDALVSGQAWHWVDPVAGAAKAAAALRPGGLLALAWNVGTSPDELQRGFTEVYRRELPDSPLAKLPTGTTSGQVYSGITEKVADGIRQTGRFGEPERSAYDWEQQYTRDEYLEMSATTGITTRLPADVLDRVLAGLGAVIDEAGGSVLCHYDTVVVTAVRNP